MQRKWQNSSLKLFTERGNPGPFSAEPPTGSVSDLLVSHCWAATDRERASAQLPKAPAFAMETEPHRASGDAHMSLPAGIGDLLSTTKSLPQTQKIGLWLGETEWRAKVQATVYMRIGIACSFAQIIRILNDLK